MTIQEAAKKVADDSLIIDSYNKFDAGKQLWVFTKNPNIESSARPTTDLPQKESKAKVDAWWKGLNIKQQRALYTGVVKEPDATIPGSISDKMYDSILKNLKNWKVGYRVFVIGQHGYTCSTFVGETLYFAGHQLTKNGKYYSAKEIWNGTHPLTKIDKDDVVPGCIAAFGGVHVEIVTDVSRILRDNFCSRGAGRGDGSNGKERCGSKFIPDQRDINGKNVCFFKI